VAGSLWGGKSRLKAVSLEVVYNSALSDLQSQTEGRVRCRKFLGQKNEG